jgi:hypothetical protein
MLLTFSVQTAYPGRHWDLSKHVPSPALLSPENAIYISPHVTGR